MWSKAPSAMTVFDYALVILSANSISEMCGAHNCSVGGCNHTPLRTSVQLHLLLLSGRRKEKPTNPILPRELMYYSLSVLASQAFQECVWIWWPAATNYLSWNYFKRTKKSFEAMSKPVCGVSSWCFTSSVGFFFLPFGGQRCLFIQFSHRIAVWSS